jgi:geranylgeranyl diphosphate synthase type I
MIQDDLEYVKKEVEKRLEKFLGEKCAEAADISPSSREMMNILKDFTLRGGKRLRAALVFYGYHCFSGERIEALWDIAMSIELVQSFLLIHDDIIDEDTMRRGGPTIHRWYQDLHRQRYTRRDPRHFGESLAIICGDIALALANEILGNAPFEDRLKCETIIAMNRMIHLVVYGECLDILSEVEDETTEEEILMMYRLKAAAYTIEGPLHMGAIMGGATKRDLQRLSRYAIPLGEAFQIQDDILGMFGDEKKLGKPIGSDIREGKKTFLILKALEKADHAKRTLIKDMLGNKDLSERDLKRVRKIIVDSGSLDYARELARRLIEDARKAMRSYTLRKEGKDFLTGIIDFILRREY